MEMGGNFCQILELGRTTIKGRRVAAMFMCNLRNMKTHVGANKHVDIMN